MDDDIGKLIGRSLARFCFVIAWKARLWPIVPYFGFISTIWTVGYLIGAAASSSWRDLFFWCGAGVFLVLPAFLLARRRQWFRVPAQPYPLFEVSVARVKPGDFKRFVGHGIRFSYPRRWKLEDVSTKENFVVMAFSRGSAMLVLTSRNPAEDGSLESFTDWYAMVFSQIIQDKGGAVVFGELQATQSQIGHDLRLGLLQPLNVKMSSEEVPYICECYHLPGGIYARLQAAEVDWPNARTGFHMVLSSLEVAVRRPPPVATQTTATTS